MNSTKLKKPNASEELAISIVKHIYGLKVISIQPMVSYDDQNFHIKVAANHSNPYISSISDDGYTLKLTNTEKSVLSGHFENMHQVMRFLHSKGHRVPVPVQNLEGNTWKLERVPLRGVEESSSIADSDLCGVHLLTFIAGKPVSTVPATEDILFQWGALLANIHISLEDFQTSAISSKDVFWSLERVPDVQPFVECLDDAKKSLVQNVLQKYPDIIGKNLSLLPRGLIHGDLNENNVLLRKDGTRYIVDGVLDFEDTHCGTYVWDIGVLLAYTIIGCKGETDPLENAGFALAGYLMNRKLSDKELSLLKACATFRITQSVVLGAYSYHMDPSNDYLLSSSKTGWQGLQLLHQTGDEQLLERWIGILRRCRDEDRNGNIDRPRKI